MNDQTKTMPQNTENKLPDNAQALAAAEKAAAEKAAAEKAAAEKAAAEKAAAEKAAAEKAAAEKAAAEKVAPIVIPQSGSKGLTVCALLIAVLSLCSSGFVWLQQQKQSTDLLEQKIEQAVLKAEKNNALLTENFNQHAQEVISRVVQIESGQKTQAQEISQIHQTYQQLINNRMNWLVNEIESALHTAALQLTSAEQTDTAIAILHQIQNRLQSFNHPDLEPLKKAVSRDLAALNSLPRFRLSDTALRLDQLQNQIAKLPLIVDNTLRPSAPKPSRPPEDEGVWWQKLWRQTLSALQTMVEVRHLENTDALLLSPEQIYYVHENLRLRLLNARTALFSRNQEIYLSDLNTAQTAVQKYFDTAAPETQAWLQELTALQSQHAPRIPSEALQASLSAVQAYQARATQVAPAEVLPPSAVEHSPAAAPDPAPAAADESQPATEDTAKGESA